MTYPAAVRGGSSFSSRSILDCAVLQCDDDRRDRRENWRDNGADDTSCERKLCDGPPVVLDKDAPHVSFVNDTLELATIVPASPLIDSHVRGILELLSVRCRKSAAVPGVVCGVSLALAARRYEPGDDDVLLAAHVLLSIHSPRRRTSPSPACRRSANCPALARLLPDVDTLQSIVH